MTIRDNRDYIRVLLYSYYTTITGWGVLVRFWVLGIIVQVSGNGKYIIIRYLDP